MARMVPASMMNTAPLNSSINVSLRLSVVSTPHRSCSIVSKRDALFRMMSLSENVPVAVSIADRYQ